MLTEERCENCRFSRPYKMLNVPDSFIACHRHAPVAVLAHAGTVDSYFSPANYADFPIVSESNWCGEWKEKSE